MDKRRTIYKLWDLRGCIFLSLINLLFGAFLLGALKAFPKLILAKIEENILNGVDYEQNALSLKSLVGDSAFLFHSTATESMLYALIALIAILFLIRLNGGIIIRKIVAWTISIGVSMINFASIMISLRFMASASQPFANQGYLVITIVGLVFFLFGLSLLFFKSLKDLSQTRPMK
jgi:hypothetical protein